LEELRHAFAKGGRRRTLGQPSPLHLEERVWHVRAVVFGPIQNNRHQKRLSPGHEVRALLRQAPLEAKVTFESPLRVGRNDWHEQGAFIDLPANALVPNVATNQFALVKPNFDSSRMQGLTDTFGRLRVLRGIAEEDGPMGGPDLGAVWHEAWSSPQGGDDPGFLPD
jgi:hypothetical protein